jgi:chromosomal replication initiation ATPase DnaA
MPYPGSEEFRSWAYEQRMTNDKDVSEHEKSLFRPDMQVIIERVAQIFNILPDSILNSVRGRRNLPRWVALYLCQIEGHRFTDIALKFGLKRTGSISTVIGKLKKLLRMDKNLNDKVNNAI